MATQSYSPQVIGAIRELVGDTHRVPLSYIGERLGCSPRTVKTICNKHQIKVAKTPRRRDLPIPFSEVQENTCRFPIGEPGSPLFHICGKKTDGTGSSYCEHHTRLCFTPAKEHGKGTGKPFTFHRKKTA